MTSTKKGHLSESDSGQTKQNRNITSSFAQDIRQAIVVNVDVNKASEGQELLRENITDGTTVLLQYDGNNSIAFLRGGYSILACVKSFKMLFEAYEIKDITQDVATVCFGHAKIHLAVMARKSIKLTENSARQAAYKSW